ncbi:hypothetical protein SALBM135S_04633 [Streptomyces alboniger]
MASSVPLTLMMRGPSPSAASAALNSSHVVTVRVRAAPAPAPPVVPPSADAQPSRAGRVSRPGAGCAAAVAVAGTARTRAVQPASRVGPMRIVMLLLPVRGAR